MILSVRRAEAYLLSSISSLRYGANRNFKIVICIRHYAWVEFSFTLQNYGIFIPLPNVFFCLF